jgi:hypothetical protein
MFNIDELKRNYLETLKRDGFAPVQETPRRPIHFKIKEFKRTKSLSLAVEIVNDLEHYHILDSETFERLTELASEAQAVKLKQKQSARRTNGKLTPEQLSERNRRAVIARWNKARESRLIKDIK